MTDSTYNIKDLEGYREFAIKAAKELCYGEKVIKLLRKAKTDNDIYTIMYNARNGVYKR